MNLLYGLIAFLSAAAFTFFLLRIYQKSLQEPGLFTVCRCLRTIYLSEQELAQSDEKEIEQKIAKKLSRFFAHTYTQVQLKPGTAAGSGAKERIDIDLGQGRFGIEIKLLKTLKSSNERNRLIGQLQHYRSLKYKRNNLMLLLAGTPDQAEHTHIKTLLHLLKEQDFHFFLLTSTKSED